MQIKRSLESMNWLFVVSAIIGVLGAMEIAKGATLHKLNFNHLKHNHEFREEITRFRIGPGDDVSGLHSVVEKIRAQPAECLKVVGPVEMVAMRVFHTYQAVGLCQVDMDLADTVLSQIEAYDRGEMSHDEFENLLLAGSQGFHDNSAAFAPLVERTVNSVLWTMLTIIALKGFIIAFFGFRLSKAVAENFNLASAAAEAANRANRLKSAFVANMSHELRTPLNGILAAAGVMDRSLLDSSQKELSGIILSSGETLKHILNDVLDISKIEAELLNLEDVPFRLRETLQPTIDLFALAAQEKGLDLKVVVDDDMDDALIGDPTRLKQVVSNLLSNAVKFTLQGHVRIHLGLVHRTEDVATIRISVADTGIGFDAEQKDKLFERFRQADDSTTREFGGTGLGLAISASIVKMMGGTLDCTSEKGVGSCFSLAVPFQLAPYDEQFVVEERTTPPQRTQTTTRILVVEDHAVNRRVAQLILEQAGFDVALVNDGQEALEDVQDTQYDLILMDMNMPRMNGIEATKAIRQLETAEHRVRTPILMLTANALPEHRQACLNAGADGHICKPITPQTMLEQILEALEEHQAGLPLAG